jgi:hypothetical protein
VILLTETIYCLFSLSQRDEAFMNAKMADVKKMAYGRKES